MIRLQFILCVARSGFTGTKLRATARIIASLCTLCH